MAPKATVFISHSSKDRALTEAVAQELASPYVDAQGKPVEGFQVLVDYEELKPGVEWPRRLHVMMARSQAAVILLTDDAVMSPWVLKEATILTWRRSLASRDGFKCIPFAAASVTDAQLDAHGFAPLALKDIQWGHNLDAAVIAADCRSLFPANPPRSLFDDLVTRLSDHLKGVGDGTLTSLADHLRVDAPVWRGPQDPDTLLTQDLAAAIITGHLGDYEGVDALLDDLLQGTASPESLRRILKWAAPAWIDLETAGRLRIAAMQQDRRCFALNGRLVRNYTAAMLTNRAYPLSDRFRVIPTAGGDAGNLADHVTREICQWLRLSGEFTDADDNDLIVAALAQVTTPQFVVLGPPVPDDGALRELRTRFPRVSFLLCTGDSVDVDATLTNVEWLRDGFSLEREQREHARYTEAQKLVKGPATWS